MNHNPQSRFIGFDSVVGLLEDWARNYPKGALSTGGWVPEIDDERVSLLKGWLQNTLPANKELKMPARNCRSRSES